MNSQISHSDAPIYQRSHATIGPPVLFSSKVSRILRLPAGQTLAERRSWTTAEITVLSGCCLVEIEGHSHRLMQFASLLIAAHLPHEITAIENLRAVITFDANSVDSQLVLSQ